MQNMAICYCTFKIQDETLARGPKLLSMYTVEQRGFLFRKYWLIVQMHGAAVRFVLANRLI